MNANSRLRHRWMKALLAGVCAVAALVPHLWGADAPGAPLGADGFSPSPEHPVGWLGDLSARYPGAHGFPLEWDATTGKNILWKAALPVGGHSSPIVVGKRVFLTCEPDLTVCLDADTGAILWQQSGDGKRKGSSGIYHHSTGYSMGTACSDGKNLFVTHYNGVVMSYDFSGKVRWRKDVPALGWSGASPCITDGKFVVLQGIGDHERRGPYDLVAYSCESGDVAWRTSALVRMCGWHYNGLVPMWVGATPYVLNYLGQFFNARDGRLVAQLYKDGGMFWVPAVESDTVVLSQQLPRSGDWRSGMLDLAKVSLPPPAGLEEAKQRDATLLIDGKLPRGKWTGFHGYHDCLIVSLKVAPDGKDGLHFEARQKPVVILGHCCDVSTSVLADSILYHIGDGNHSKPSVAVLDLRTGAALSPGGYDGLELKPSRPVTNGVCNGASLLYSHPVTAGGYFMVSDWQGRTHVFSRAPDFRELAVNLTTNIKKPPAGNPISGPAGGLESSEFYQGNRIYFRHWDALYCIGDPQAAEHAAAFAAAKAHADAGRTQPALRAYHQLWSAEPLHVRYRAIREMGAVLGSQAADELSQAFRHPDPNLRALAVSVATQISGEAMTRKLVEGLNDSDPAYRGVILAALGQRGDRSTSPQLATALDDKAAEVRMAAIAAAGRIGGTVAVQAVVAHLERFGEPERQAALGALTAMPEPDTERSLAGLVSQASPVARGILLRALGNRGVSAQTALVLKSAGHADRAVRLAALEALGLIAGAQELDPIVARMALAQDDGERRAIEGALSGILRRTRAADVFTAAVLRGVPTVHAAGLASLIRVLGPAGGKASLMEVRKALSNPDAATHGAAIEALAAWPDPAPQPELMALADTERDAANLATVARGLLRMIDLSPKRPADEIFGLYAQALKTGQALDTTIVHMEDQKDARTIESVAGLLGDKGLDALIVNTMCNVAEGAAEKDAARTIAALTKAAEKVKDRHRLTAINNAIGGLRRKYKQVK